MTRLICQCSTRHEAKRVVLTGGPGAGKTAVLEALRGMVCEHVVILPEAATILFARGFPLSTSVSGIRLIQRAIFRIQDEQERMAMADGSAGIVLCNRGILDGLAYWPGTESSFFAEMLTTREEVFKRYDLVIHLRARKTEQSEHLQNPARLEFSDSPSALDQRIADGWEGHPNRVFLHSTPDVREKVQHTLRLVLELLPPYCQAVHGANFPAYSQDSSWSFYPPTATPTPSWRE